MRDEHTYTAEWDEEDQIFVAKVEEFPSLMAHGPSAEKAIQELRQVVRANLDDLAVQSKTER